MHYSKSAFSSNGKETIVPIDKNYVDRIGSKDLSPDDVTRINSMYKCKASATFDNRLDKVKPIGNWLDQIKASLGFFHINNFRNG
jgi:Astacin (Peptidase family M12A)